MNAANDKKALLHILSTAYCDIIQIFYDNS